MANEMIERVTGVIELGLANDEPSEAIARAVIGAMMDPTPEMWQAGDDAGGKAGEWTSDGQVHDARKSYPAMLSAALEQPHPVDEKEGI